MSIELEQENTVSVETVDPIGISTDDNKLEACVEKTDGLELTVNKREYSIVGDALYAGMTNDEAPQWLTGIIDDVVNGLVSDKLNALDTAISSINQSLLELDVAKNQYQELINIEKTIDGVLATKLETLNATVAQNSANVISLDITKATPEEALAISIDHVNAEINNGAIYGLATELTTALANAEGAWSSQVTSLKTDYNGSQSTIEQILSSESGPYGTGNNVILDLNSALYGEDGVSGIAGAQETLETYVGYDIKPGEDIPAQLANQKTTLLSQIDLQTDKAISYWFQDSTVDPATTVAPNGWLDEDDAAHYGDLWYKEDLETAHRYSSTGWATATVQEKKLLDDIASNKTLAENKVTVYKYSTYVANGKPVDGNGFPTPAGIAAVTNTDIGTTFTLEDNDLLILTYTVSTEDYTDMYEYSGGAWNTSGGGLVARSNWAVDLDAWIGNAGAESSLTTAVKTTSNGEINTAFEYGSVITKDGVSYNTGFGLNSFSDDSGDGTGTSEFWINAEKFRFTNGTTNTLHEGGAVFTIDTTDNNKIKFNGKVTFGTNSVIDAAGDTTTINGGDIEAGSITTAELKSEAIWTNVIYDGDAIEGSEESTYTMKINFDEGSIHIR